VREYPLPKADQQLRQRMLRGGEIAAWFRDTWPRLGQPWPQIAGKTGTLNPEHPNGQRLHWWHSQLSGSFVGALRSRRSPSLCCCRWLHRKRQAHCGQLRGTTVPVFCGLCHWLFQFRHPTATSWPGVLIERLTTSRVRYPKGYLTANTSLLVMGTPALAESFQRYC